jgi:hypothetical protein
MDGNIRLADAQIEQIAQLIHEDYLEQLDEVDPTLPTHRPWAELGERERELNRDQARDNLVKLRAHGLVVTTEPTDDEVRHIPDALLEGLAMEEHESWMERRYAAGYRYGPERCDESPDLRHPDMVDWDDLREEVREKDRRPIRNIPAHLRAVGLTLVRA